MNDRFIHLGSRAGETSPEAHAAYAILTATFGPGRVSRTGATGHRAAIPGPDQVFLPLIDDAWHSAINEEGIPLLFQEDDPLRLEIAAALRFGSTTVPVVTIDENLLLAAELPAEIRPLLGRPHIRLGTNGSGFEALIPALYAIVPDLNRRESVAPTTVDLAVSTIGVHDHAIAQAPVSGPINNHFHPPAPPERQWRSHWRPERPQSQFTGRAEELAALDTAFENRGSSLVYAVDGLGGIGKTALAVSWTERVAEGFSDGTIYLNFHSYSPDRRPMTAEEALRELLLNTCPDLTTDQVNKMPPEELVRTWHAAIDGKNIVMVWDNIREASQIEPILVRRAGCATVVTSRVNLNLEGSYRVHLEEMSVEDAVGVFLTDARNVHGLKQAAPSEDLVQRLVEADLCIPVLVVHHANQVRSGYRTVERILAEIEQLPREDVHQVLYDRFAISYHELESEVRFAFRALGAHPGDSLTIRAAAAAMSCRATEAGARLDSLVRAAFVKHDATPLVGIDLGSYAYAAHDLISEYANKVAEDESEEFGRIRAALLAHYRERVGNEPEGPFFELESASALAVAQTGSSPEHAALALELGPGLETIGRFRSSVEAYEHALECNRQDGFMLGVARALVGLGTAKRILGEWDVSNDYLKESMSLFEAEDDQDGRIDAAIGLGHISRLRSDYPTGAEYFEYAAVQAAEIGDAARQSRALTGWGHSLRLLKLPEEAKRCFREAADVGDLQGKANSIRGLADVLRRQGDLEAAADCYRQSAEAYEELGDRNGQANLALGLGAVARLQGRLEDAAAHFQRANDIFTELGNKFGCGGALRGLGNTAGDAGDRDLARSYLQRSLELYERFNNNATKHVRRELRELDDEDA